MTYRFNPQSPAGRVIELRMRERLALAAEAARRRRPPEALPVADRCGALRDLVHRRQQRRLAGGQAAEPPPSAAVIAYNRLAFGPRPGDIDAFNALGSSDGQRLTAWIDQQLDP